MKIELPIEKLRERKLFIATPCYGGKCENIYMKSMADLSALCTHYGVQMRLYTMSGESLIQRARNYCADEFMRSGDTHLMFIDADIGFNPHDVIQMLALMSPDPADDNYDVLCGPYPKKTIAWEKIKAAVDKGFADENPNELEKFVGDYVFNPANGKNQISLGEPAEILEGGTGFMMIRRATFEKFAETYPKQSYRPDHVRSENFDGSREIMAFFDCPIDGKYSNLDEEVELFIKATPTATAQDVADFIKDPKMSMKEYSKRYLSEDYYYCQWARKAGLKVWLCGWMKLQHVGNYTFGGSLQDLAQIGASATASENLKKRKGVI